MVEKYQHELIEILEELIEYKPSLMSHIGVSQLFNWRAIFDFSSEAWTNFSSDSRTTIINALAEKRTLFIALMTFKTMYIEMNRSDIANAAGLSLARFFENITDPGFVNNYDQLEMAAGENLY
jgi:hypothetical protein